VTTNPDADNPLRDLVKASAEAQKILASCPVERELDEIVAICAALCAGPTPRLSWARIVRRLLAPLDTARARGVGPEAICGLLNVTVSAALSGQPSYWPTRGPRVDLRQQPPLLRYKNLATITTRIQSDTESSWRERGALRLTRAGEALPDLEVLVEARKLSAALSPSQEGILQLLQAKRRKPSVRRTRPAKGVGPSDGADWAASAKVGVHVQSEPGRVPAWHDRLRHPEDGETHHGPGPYLKPTPIEARLASTGPVRRDERQITGVEDQGIPWE
jgi:hypothetical protein